MVKVLSEHFITGACHAPVDSRQGERRQGVVGSFWMDKGCYKLIVVKKGERYNETGKIRI